MSTVAITFADELRARSDEDLATVFKLRPDLVTPVPNDFSALAARASYPQEHSQQTEPSNSQTHTDPPQHETTTHLYHDMNVVVCQECSQQDVSSPSTKHRHTTQSHNTSQKRYTPPYLNMQTDNTLLRDTHRNDNNQAMHNDQNDSQNYTTPGTDPADQDSGTSPRTPTTLLHAEPNASSDIII